jgi:signal transduction histidine kinase
MLTFPEKYGLNEEAKRHQGLMIESAKREERIVNRMLEYSMMNVEGEDIRPEHRKFFPHNVVEVVLNSKKLKSEADVELGIPKELTIESDMDFFYNIIAEFCSNAVQYSSPPRKIRISSHQDGDNVGFSVTDNGIGMTDEVAHAIFTPFFIGDGTHLSRKYGRLGLGLPIAKRLAALLGGNIKVESKVGKGSTFTLVLPKRSG